jgi:tetratricopeptide (TPR) repeat protein
MMKRFVVVTAAVLLLAGCKDTGQKKPVSIPAAAAHHAKTEPPQRPYYQGLIDEYRTILTEDPNNLAAIIGLGNAYFESGAWREAIDQYHNALRIAPRNADVHSDMGVAYRNLGMPERALAQYRLALLYEPGHLNARYNMGIVYGFDLKNYPAAVRAWEELLLLAPTYSQADYMRTCMARFKKNNDGRDLQ